MAASPTLLPLAWSHIAGPMASAPAWLCARCTHAHKACRHSCGLAKMCCDEYCKWKSHAAAAPHGLRSWPLRDPASAARCWQPSSTFPTMCSLQESTSTSPLDRLVHTGLVQQLQVSNPSVAPCRRSLQPLPGPSSLPTSTSSVGGGWPRQATVPSGSMAQTTLSPQRGMSMRLTQRGP